MGKAFFMHLMEYTYVVFTESAYELSSNSQITPILSEYKEIDVIELFYKDHTKNISLLNIFIKLI